MPPSLPRKTRTGVAGSPSTVERSKSIACWSAWMPTRPVPPLATAVHVSPPSVDAAQAHVGVEDVVLVLRVDPDLAEPPLEAAVGRVRAAADAQRVAAVVGVVEALVRAGRAARDDVDAVRVARRDGDADAAEARVRLQAGLRLVIGRQRVDDVLQPLPRVAAVLGAEEAGADAAVDARAVRAPVVPQRGVDDVRVRRVDLEVDAAGVRRRRGDHALPGLAGVLGAVDAALRRPSGRCGPPPPRTRGSSSSGRPRCARTRRSPAGPCAARCAPSSVDL